MIKYIPKNIVLVNILSEAMHMKKVQNVNIENALANLKMSFQMEGLNVTDEIQKLCLSVINGSKSLNECLEILNSKYKN